MESARYAAMLANGQVVNHYQPIVDLRSGTVTGVEVLARLIDGERLILPDLFLPGLSVDALADLLFVSLPMGLTALAACTASHPGLTISFNVSPRVMLQDEFRETFLGVLALTRTSPQRVTLEVLEDDEFLNLDSARTELVRLHESGLRIAPATRLWRECVTCPCTLSSSTKDSFAICSASRNTCNSSQRCSRSLAGCGRTWW